MGEGGGGALTLTVMRLVAMEAQVAEARCVYGPGSSEYSRVIGHSRAEA